MDGGKLEWVEDKSGDRTAKCGALTLRARAQRGDHRIVVSYPLPAKLTARGSHDGCAIYLDRLAEDTLAAWAQTLREVLEVRASMALDALPPSYYLCGINIEVRSTCKLKVDVVMLLTALDTLARTYCRGDEPRFDGWEALCGHLVAESETRKAKIAAEEARNARLDTLRSEAAREARTVWDAQVGEAVAALKAAYKAAMDVLVKAAEASVLCEVAARLADPQGWEGEGDLTEEDRADIARVTAEVVPTMAPDKRSRGLGL